MSSGKLSSDQIGHELTQHPGWQVVDNHHLRREWKFADFAGALAFVNAVGAASERLNHHPNIAFTWGRATIEIWSHDVNGLTGRDFALADAIDSLPG